MAWLVLIVSGVFEAVWAAALDATQGFTRLVPTLVFAVAIVASMAGLAYAVRDLPLGTAYAVWTSIGAVGTVAYGVVALGESLGVLRLLCLVAIVAGVVGLKLVS